MPRLHPIVREESVVERPGAENIENPYWIDDEEAAPHPDPSLGCIRRGLCCKSSPGWFAPGEVERAAESLGMSPDAFARQFLVIDSTDVDGERVEVFAPLKLARDGTPAIAPLARADVLYRTLRGRCVFFEGEGCRIYAARPHECKHYVCTNAPELNPSHESIARLWRSP